VDQGSPRYERLLTLYQDRVATYFDVDDDFEDRWLRWCRRLLWHGGALVVPPPHPEPDLDELLASASGVAPDLRVLAGDENACHANAAVLWIDGAVAAIGTGYALSDDDLWRQHSWAVDADGTIVETTSARRAYVGLTLTGATPPLKFAAGNAGQHLKSVMSGTGTRARELQSLLQQSIAERTPTPRFPRRP
jgi:hypothetical protein